MSKPIGRMFAKALEEAGVVTDLNTVERIVIDIDAMFARVYVQRIGDDRLLDLFRGQLGLMLAENAPKPIACCDLHGRNCEPEEPCCEDCTETRHAGWVSENGFQQYGHPRGEKCSRPDLSDGSVT